MEKFAVYVLKSLKNGKCYVGSTSKELTKRLDWHRWGLTAWTRQNGPFELLYSEERDTKQEALRREKYFKTGQGRRTLELLVKNQKFGTGAPATKHGGELIARLEN